MSSCLNDLMNCKRYLYVDIMKLYISYGWSSNVHLLSINRIIKYCLCTDEKLNFSSMALYLSSGTCSGVNIKHYVLQAWINTICK